MRALVDRIEASNEARERTKVILATLGRQESVQEGCARLGIKRTRFQDLRRRMMAGAVEALEERPAGRPRSEQASVCAEREALRGRVAALEHELELVRTELAIARSGAGAAVAARLAARGQGR
jgi:hypothetical protein